MDTIVYCCESLHKRGVKSIIQPGAPTGNSGANYWQTVPMQKSKRKAFTCSMASVLQCKHADHTFTVVLKMIWDIYSLCNFNIEFSKMAFTLVMFLKELLIVL